MKIASASSRTNSTIGATVLCCCVTFAGCHDGTVEAKGQVIVDGNPAARGRLTLSPVGGGERAFAMVADDGTFSLMTSEGAEGAIPGAYRANFQQVLDAKTRSILANQLSDEISAGEINVLYENKNGDPVMIPESGTDNLEIDIRENLGWKRFFSE